MSQAEFKKRLKVLMNKPENQVCSDCPERQPRWASLIVPPPGSPPGALPIGAFCCLECSGSHRRLGVHISFVRSITLDSWKEKEVLAMENGGNAKVNAIFEAKLHNPSAKPTTGASGPVRERYIRDKYERRKYYDPSVLVQYANAPTPAAAPAETVSKAPSRRVPSEAARMRAQARQARSSTKSRSMPTSAPPPPPAAAPEFDLLDFSSPITADPGPPPDPPSAAPSPALDMFKNMNVQNNAAFSTQSSRNSMPRSQTAPATSSNNLAPQVQSKKMTSDDILAMFHTPSQPQQQQFGNFANMNMNNNNMMQQGNMGMMGGMNSKNNNNQFGNNNMMNMNNMMQQNMTQQQGNMGGMSNNFNMMQNQQGGMGGNVNMGMMGSSNNNNSNNQSFGNMNMGMMGMNNQQNNMMNMNQQNQNMMSGMGMSNSNMNNNNNMMQQPMGGAPSNMNTMGGNTMGNMSQNQSFNSMAGNISMDNQGFPISNSASGGSSNVMGGTANTSQNQFASFGSFR